MPNISVVLFIVAIGAFLFWTQRHDAQERRSKLIEDILWQEQTIRLALQANEEVLGVLARDLGQGQLTEQAFQTRAAFLVRNNPELVHVLWIGPDRLIRWAAPAASAGGLIGHPVQLDAQIQAFNWARVSGRRAYGPAYRIGPNDSRFDVQIPVFRDGAYAGTLAASYSIQGILEQQVPWWYAQRYQLQVLDGAGHVLASKLGLAKLDPEQDYEVLFDPPGYGLMLKASAYRTDTPLAERWLLALVVGLSVIMAWSLWAQGRHIQQRARAEQALQAESAFRKAMEDSMLTGLRAVDMEGRITYVNPAFCRMVGLAESELLGRRPPMPYWAPEDLARASATFDAMLAGQAPVAGVERRFCKPNGERLDVVIYTSPLIDGRGRQTGWMTSVNDVTERKRMEEMFRQQMEKIQATARLVTMGEMASTLAHELNQPLSAIASYNTGCINLLQGDHYTRKELLDALEKVAAQAQRAGKIVQSVRDFVRKSEPRKAPCQVNEVVAEAAGFAEIEARKRLTHVVLDLDPALPEVVADRLMIGQIVLNLVKNGIEAMDEVPADEREVTVRTDRPEEGVIRVSVSDRGRGISSEVAQRLFEPFFTTKPDGMGMGLNICRSIVELHNGRLWVEPNSPRGSVFRFTLPC